MTETAAQWFVVRTKAQKEEVARVNLEHRGIKVYLPRIVEASFGGQTGPAPLFPCYLFVQINLREDYHRVIWTPGVRNLVAFGDEPAPLDEQVVTYLMSRTGPDGLIRRESGLRVGDRVRITHGPFAGLVGIIERACSRKGRIKVLMDFLRQGVVVDLPLVAVGRV